MLSPMPCYEHLWWWCLQSHEVLPVVDESDGMTLDAPHIHQKVVLLEHFLL